MGTQEHRSEDVAVKSTHKFALVTGASNGIGLEMARLLAALEYDLVLVSRNTGKLSQVADTLRKNHQVNVQVCAADLSEPGSAVRVFEFVAGQGLEVDVLINNAGVGLYGEHLELDLSDLDRMIQLNITSLIDLCLLFGQRMKSRGQGRILNISSTAAYQPAPYFAAYGASKSFVLNFSEAFAKELEDYGVTVSCLSPGPTDTSFFARVDALGIQNGHFDKGDRVDARTVAAIGIKMMMAGRISKIVGVKNYLRAWSGRLASRAMVARVSKNLLMPERKSGGRNP